MTGLEALESLAHEIEAFNAGAAETGSANELVEIIVAMEMMRDWLERAGTEDARKQVARVLVEHNWNSPATLVAQSHVGLLSGLCALLKSVLALEVHHSERT